MTRLAKLLIRLYRLVTVNSPRRCRYHPTCSAYAYASFTRHGFVLGLILSLFRVLRCNPLSKGGYDPVPELGFISKIW